MALAHYAGAVPQPSHRPQRVSTWPCAHEAREQPVPPPHPWLAPGCTRGSCPGSVRIRLKNNGYAAQVSDPLSIVPGVPVRAGTQAFGLEILAAIYTDLMIMLCHRPQSAHSTIVLASDLHARQPYLPLFYR